MTHFAEYVVSHPSGQTGRHVQTNAQRCIQKNVETITAYGAKQLVISPGESPKASHNPLLGVGCFHIV